MSTDIVPEPVIVPPLRPVPVATEVTVPVLVVAEVFIVTVAPLRDVVMLVPVSYTHLTLPTKRIV